MIQLFAAFLYMSYEQVSCPRGDALQTLGSEIGQEKAEKDDAQREALIFDIDYSVLGVYPSWVLDLGKANTSTTTFLRSLLLSIRA